MPKAKMTSQNSQPGSEDKENQKLDVKISRQEYFGSDQITLVQSSSAVDRKQGYIQENRESIEAVWSLDTDHVESLNRGRTTLHDIHADIVDKTNDEKMCTQGTDLKGISYYNDMIITLSSHMCKLRYQDNCCSFGDKSFTEKAKKEE
eukprot:GFUD01135691.1.p1 GENE.GFUD01135691.1~~GFUD01135691.1.p1  ORF type:complete len:148 (+),score=45.39 GFUD01135691.1:76-519(+)